jgi:hypothetical protein
MKAKKVAAIFTYPAGRGPVLRIKAGDQGMVRIAPANGYRGISQLVSVIMGELMSATKVQNGWTQFGYQQQCLKILKDF